MSACPRDSFGELVEGGMSMKHTSDQASITLRYTQGDKHDNHLVNIAVLMMPIN